MKITEILNLAGLIFNIIGSVLLAMSLSKYLTAIHGTAVIHDKQLKAIINGEKKVLVGDVGNLLKVGIENGRIRTAIGILLIVTGFIFQLLPYLAIFYRHYIANSV